MAGSTVSTGRDGGGVMSEAGREVNQSVEANFACRTGTHI